MVTMFAVNCALLIACFSFLLIAPCRASSNAGSWTAEADRANKAPAARGCQSGDYLVLRGGARAPTVVKERDDLGEIGFEQGERGGGLAGFEEGGMWRAL